ncbi:MAG: hypothetical protein L3J59_15540 [Methylococcaceae bacterium]|nr:hypothetical protein [Methylococcaceae bacterium]
MELEFEIFDKELITYNQKVVMTRKEEPYFNRLFQSLEKLQPKTVLEIGYGLGISAFLIQKYFKPDSHLIFEIEKKIGGIASTFSQGYSNVEVIIDDWANINNDMTFDFIFFDPFDYSECSNMTREETAEKLKQLLGKNGVLSHPHFGDGEASEFLGFNHSIIERFKIPPFETGDGFICEDVASIIRCREEDDMEKILQNI